MKKWASVLAVASMSVGCGGGGQDPAAETAPAVEAGAALEAPARPEAPTSGAPARTAAAPTAAARSGAAPAATPAPVAPPAPTFREVTVPAGTTLRLQLRSAVASDSSKVEDVVRAELREAVSAGGATVLPEGTELVGNVTEVERSGRVKGRARVAYRFTTLSHAGERYDIATAPLVHEAEATKGEDAKKVAIGAGAGAAIGALIGGGSGAAKGAAVGAAGGTGLVLATRGEEVRLESGASITTTLSDPLTIRVRVN